MKYLINHKVIILAIFMFFTTHSFAADKILPLPKPKVGKELIKDNKKSKFIFPENKPLSNLEKKTPEEKIVKTEDLTADNKKTEKQDFIYPEKKPVIVQKKVKKTLKKSTVLSKKDFEIAKTTFEFIDKKKMDFSIKNF